MSEQSPQMTEPEFRHLAEAAYRAIENAFDDVDPDEAECEVAQGALTISLPGGQRWVLSQQPPVRQLWLAVASQGRAYHFDYNAAEGTWHDDKGEGIELMSFLRGLLKDVAGVEVAL